ncbi:MAG: hypothetical protein CM1200mP39_30710 [Dehalococcoidia bacterium]|nr:MAG: hypothetical protein CM1200mP39_30710 [Dehalococcoidia bacterium]
MPLIECSSSVLVLLMCRIISLASLHFTKGYRWYPYWVVDAGCENFGYPIIATVEGASDQIGMPQT